MNDQDDDLDRRFAGLRRWDARHTPGFDAVVRRPRPRRPLAPLLGSVLVAAGLVLSVVIFRLRGRSGEGAMSILIWRSPTASLLNLPGAKLLTTVPSLSESIIHTEEP